MAKLGFYFDMSRCTGCKACQVACKDRNNLESGIFFRKVDAVPVESQNGTRLRYASMACAHCAEPACVAVCPTGAMHKREDGTVGHHAGMCIGCGGCVWRCPNGAPTFSKSMGISRKCDACAELRDQGKNPACVDACPNRCLEFGDLEELEKKYGPGLLHELPGQANREDTHPSLLIKASPRREENNRDK